MKNSSGKLSYVGKKVFVGIDVHKRTYSVVTVVEGVIVKKWTTAAIPEKLAIQLVVCQELIDGYSRFNLIRASSVVNCQSALEEI